MPAPISPADKAAFIAGWAAVKTAFNKVSSLGRGVPEVGVLASAVAAIDSAIPGWRSGRVSDADFAQLYKRLGPASIAVGDTTRRLQSYGLMDAINEFQAEADNLNGYLMDYWDAGPMASKATMAIVIGAVGLLAVGLIVATRRA